MNIDNSDKFNDPFGVVAERGKLPRAYHCVEPIDSSNSGSACAASDIEGFDIRTFVDKLISSLVFGS